MLYLSTNQITEYSRHLRLRPQAQKVLDDVIPNFGLRPPTAKIDRGADIATI